MDTHFLWRVHALLIQNLLLVSIAIGGRGDFSMNCEASEDDPHQCAYTAVIQKCYRVKNGTMCDKVTWECKQDCCDGWKSDMQAKCTIPTPKSDCPKFYINPENGDTRFCYNDTFCHQDEICCTNVCVKRRPISSNKCLYDNEFHTIGETITETSDICQTCACEGNIGRNATMTCTNSVCDFSGNDTVIPANYTPPEVLNLPAVGKSIRVFVLPNRNVAYFNHDHLVGKDFEGNNISFTVSKDTFHHCLCNKSSNVGDIVNIRTDRDKFGNFNETTFSVDIIDKYKPVFTNCPNNITVMYCEPIVWSAPEVTDNVGIMRLRKPVLRNNSLLAPGSYVEKYVATDWSDNTASCSFTIHVTRPSAPSSNNNTIIIIGGTTGGILCCTRRTVYRYCIPKKKKTIQLLNINSLDTM